MSVLENRTSEQRKKLETQIAYLNQDIARLKETIQIKEQEVKNLNINREQ